MVDWQVTAITIYCDAVDDEVTILINKDWTTRCIGYFEKYGDQTFTKKRANELKKKSIKLGRTLQCEGPECAGVILYLDKLRAEEVETKSQGDV